MINKKLKCNSQKNKINKGMVSSYAGSIEDYPSVHQ